jgi:hypothetical protein
MFFFVSICFLFLFFTVLDQLSSLQICYFLFLSHSSLFQVAARPRGRRLLGFCRVWPVLDEEGAAAADGEDRGSVAAEAAMEMVVGRLS